MDSCSGIHDIDIGVCPEPTHFDRAKLILELRWYRCREKVDKSARELYIDEAVSKVVQPADVSAILTSVR